MSLCYRVCVSAVQCRAEHAPSRTSWSASCAPPPGGDSDAEERANGAIWFWVAPPLRRLRQRFHSPVFTQLLNPPGIRWKWWMFLQVRVRQPLLFKIMSWLLQSSGYSHNSSWRRHGYKITAHENMLDGDGRDDTKASLAAASRDPSWNPGEVEYRVTGCCLQLTGLNHPKKNTQATFSWKQRHADFLPFSWAPLQSFSFLCNLKILI